jgi:thioredoxin-related protein
MKTDRLAVLASIGLTICLSVTPSIAAPPAAAAIYDTKADGAKQIAQAVAAAKKEDKRVLVILGANWCPWCRQLHKVFESEATVKGVLDARYVVVFVDVDGNHNRGVDIDLGDVAQNGIPQMIILDATGKKLLNKDPADLEENRSYSVPKLTEFLQAQGGAAPKKGS